MPVDPRTVVSGDNPWIVAYQLSDHQRRLAALEAARTVIGADAIIGANIAPNSITTTEIAAGTITASDIASNTITAAQIAANTITAGQIAANTITATQIAANTITAGQIAASTITAAQIAAATITASLIAANAITTNAINAGAVTAVKIAANTITANEIAAGTITATQIATDTLTASQIATGAITATELAANSVTATAILAGTIDSTKLNVTTLSSITANMGAITAGTITGGTLQTATTGSRVVMDSAGLRGYALDGVTKVFEINAGSGVASFTGVATIAAGSVVPANTIASGGVSGVLGGGNMLSNSSFESTASFSTGWTASGGGSTITAETTIVHTGGTSAKIILGAVGGFGLQLLDTATPKITVGDHYVGSAWVYLPSPSTMRVYLQTRDVSNATIDSVQKDTVVPANTWTRIFSPVLTPTTTAAKVRILVYNPTGTIGFTFYVDDVQVENGDVPTSYAPRVDEILPGIVGTTELAALAVTAAKIAANTITASQIAANTITAGQIASATITATQIAAGAITTTLLAAGAVTAQKLSLVWGGSNMLLNSSFENTVSNTTSWSAATNGTFAGSTTQKYDGLNSGKLTVTASATLASVNQLLAVKSSTLYTYSYYVFNPAGSSKTVSPYIDWYSDAAGTVNVGNSNTDVVVTAGSWQRLTITATSPATAVAARPYLLIKAANAVAADIFYFDAVQFEPGEIASAYGRSPGEILPGEVGNTQLAPDSVTTSNILANTIIAADIASATITGTQIAAGTITASHITTATLSAISANLGTITAGTITGATFQTSASNPRVVMNSSGINAFDASAVNIFNLNASAGTLDMTGHLTSTGIDVPEPVTSALSGIPPNVNQVRWLQSGTARSWIGGDFVSATVPIVINIHRMSVVGQDRVFVQTGATYSSPTTLLDLDGQAATITAKTTGQGRVIIANTGFSDFIQNMGSTTVKLQTGRATVSVGAGADVDVPITLAFSWPSNHHAFVANVQPLSTWSGFAIKGSFPDPASVLTRGMVHVSNTAGTQNVTVNFVSLGN